MVKAWRAATCLIIAFAVSVSAARKAEASSLGLDIEITYLQPTVGPSDATFTLNLFQSPTNAWPGAFPSSILAKVQGTLTPGINEFSVFLADVDQSQLYFNAFGSYWSGPGFAFPSIFVAEPPGGDVPDQLAYAYGPPWISLAGLGQGSQRTGSLRTIWGYSNHDGSWVEGNWRITPVPEPTSIALLGTGIAAMLIRRRRRNGERQ